LTGSVQSWQERDLAETLTKGVAGVTDVENSIDVRGIEDRPDQEIKADIQQTLRWDTLVDDGLIDVDVNDGKVLLSGTVGSAAERRRATRNAWTAGVVSVDDSQLVVARWTRDPELREDKYVIKEDADIEAAVRRALEIDPWVDGENVEVSALAGVVTLRGRVGNLQAKRSAGSDARNTVGVIDVVNRLSVRPSADVDDKELANKVTAALLQDPYVDRFELLVSVINGRVHLDGTVDSHFEKARADTVASNVDGVVHVVNNLEVRREGEAFRFDPYVDPPYVYDFDWSIGDSDFSQRSDAEIKDSVESELWWNPFVDSDAITVIVEDGVVILKGTVDSWSEYAAAREDAYEGGALRVINDLRVAESG
jgi:osmotically-inducible protein OsmY